MELFTEHTPPNLEGLFGYQKSNRWVAFYWGRKIGTYANGYIFDGKTFGPINQLAWDIFFGHPLIVAMNHHRISGSAVKRFEFGDAYQPSKHWLLLDRQESLLYAALRACAHDHLRAVTSSAIGQLTNFTNNLSLNEKPHRPAAPISKGALEMIAEMTLWLDNRKAYLQQNGQWPILS